jgi:soluble lytic murein transglycosylase
MLSWLYDYYGDWETTFAAYNAGPGRVDSWLEDERYSSDGKLTHIPNSETRSYVQKQLQNIEKYEKLYYTGE